MGLHWENEWTENQWQALPIVAQTLAGLEHLDLVLPFSFASPLEDHPLFAVVVLSLIVYGIDSLILRRRQKAKASSSGPTSGR